MKKPTHTTFVEKGEMSNRKIKELSQKTSYLKELNYTRLNSLKNNNYKNWKNFLNRRSELLE